MGICAAVGGAVFGITLLLSLLWLLGSFFRNIGVTYFGPVGVLFSIVLPVMCFWMEVMIFHYAPHAWGAAIVFIILNLYHLFLQNMLLTGSLFIGEKHIYRIGHGFAVKKYTFSEIIKCSGNYSSGTFVSKVGQRKATTFDIQVRFSDGTQGGFSTKQKDSPKARYFLDTIKARRRSS